jgi:membrane associated rhomboid family serine protease
MFIPYRDVNPSGTIPYVTVGLIAANGLAFLAQSMADQPSAMFAQYGLSPQAFLSAWRTGGVFQHAIMPLFTNLFLHAGWIHFTANMLYLWVFGDNIEDRLGHAEFLVFYLICGIIASLAHVVYVPKSAAPLIGASGAISGILGAYFVCFPKARVWVMIFFRPTEMRAYWFLGIWFGLQLLLGIAGIGAKTGGGVAYMAHIGGFVVGVALILLFPLRGEFRDKSDQEEAS